MGRSCPTARQPDRRRISAVWPSVRTIRTAAPAGTWNWTTVSARSVATGRTRAGSAPRRHVWVARRRCRGASCRTNSESARTARATSPGQASCSVGRRSCSARRAARRIPTATARPAPTTAMSRLTPATTPRLVTPGYRWFRTASTPGPTARASRLNAR